MIFATKAPHPPLKYNSMMVYTILIIFEFLYVCMYVQLIVSMPGSMFT